jgi:hypothetical protein
MNVLIHISKGPGDEEEGGEDDMEGRERYDQDVQVNGRGPIYRVTITKVGTIQPNGKIYMYRSFFYFHMSMCVGV